MFASDQKNNEDVKRQVLHVWDQLYHSWFGKVNYFKGTDHVGTFMGLKYVVYYANYRSGHQSSKIQVVP